MKIKHPFYLNSQCGNSWLHRFSIVKQYPQGVLEVCEICHLTKFFKIMDNKVDNLNYMAWHIHEALPPLHPRYKREYPIKEILSPYV